MFCTLPDKPFLYSMNFKQLKNPPNSGIPKQNSFIQQIFGVVRVLVYIFE